MPLPIATPEIQPTSDPYLAALATSLLSEEDNEEQRACLRFWKTPLRAEFTSQSPWRCGWNVPG